MDTELLVTPRQRAARANGTLAKHRVGFRPIHAQPIHSAFDLLAFVPTRAHGITESIVDRRASWSAIRGWRTGRRRLPDWALDMLLRRLLPFVETWQALDKLKKERAGDQASPHTSRL